MKKQFLISGAIFGALAVALGAMGAHALKDILSKNLLDSYETGVRYQMYHALLLVLLSNIKMLRSKFIFYTLVIGIVFFSFSIYLLSLREVLQMESLTAIGPITPIGGVLLITAWLSILTKAVKINK